ncbi:MAG: putative PEP-binding protein, partial [Spirochaetota bacterium]
EDQYTYYKNILEKMGKNREITFRTLDIGNDKLPSYFPKEECDNSALGVRGIRFTLQHKELFKKQLKALLKASSLGKIKIMLPMINSIKEVVQTKTLIEQEKQNLISDGIEVSSNIKYGIMVETPAAVLSLESFVKHIDFISIGTNDLIQYLFAVDRNNEKVEEYYDNHHPALINSLKIIYDFSKKFDVPVSLCGELNADINVLPLLIGLGFRRFSLNPILIPNIYKVISEMNSKKCKDILYSHYKL